MSRGLLLVVVLLLLLLLLVVLQMAWVGCGNPLAFKVASNFVCPHHASLLPPLLMLPCCLCPAPGAGACSGTATATPGWLSSTSTSSSCSGERGG